MQQSSSWLTNSYSPRQDATQGFITVFTRACHLSPPPTRPIRSRPFQLISFRLALVVFFHIFQVVKRHQNIPTSYGCTVQYNRDHIGPTSNYWTAQLRMVQQEKIGLWRTEWRDLPPSGGSGGGGGGGDVGVVVVVPSLLVEMGNNLILKGITTEWTGCRPRLISHVLLHH